MHLTSDIPATEPTEFIQGDTIKWTKDLKSHYPASTWALTYAFRLQNGSGAGNDKLDKTASASGADPDVFAVTLSLTDTAALTVGIWIWQAYASKSGERYLVDSGLLEITKNLAGVTATYDGRSHVKKVMDALQAVIENRATATDLEIEIHGRRIQHMSHEQLVKAWSFYKGQYAAEVAADKIKNGEASGHKILVRFP